MRLLVKHWVYSENIDKNQTLLLQSFNRYSTFSVVVVVVTV